MTEMINPVRAKIETMTDMIIGARVDAMIEEVQIIDVMATDATTAEVDGGDNSRHPIARNLRKFGSNDFAGPERKYTNS